MSYRSSLIRLFSGLKWIGYTSMFFSANFSSPAQKYRELLLSPWCWCWHGLRPGSHLGETLSGKLSCAGTDLVTRGYNLCDFLMLPWTTTLFKRGVYFLKERIGFERSKFSLPLRVDLIVKGGKTQNERVASSENNVPLYLNILSKCTILKCVTELWEYRGYHISVYWYQVYQERPKAVWKWWGLPSQFDVFLVDPDKFYIKRHMFFCLSFKDFKA